VSTVLGDASKAGHVFLDRQLYLPQEWCWDRKRRAKAKVPAEIQIHNKTEQDLAMHEVTGDAVYGEAPRLRKDVQEHSKWCVLAVSSTIPVWTERPAVLTPQEQTDERPRRPERLAPGAAKAPFTRSPHYFIADPRDHSSHPLHRRAMHRGGQRGNGSGSVRSPFLALLVPAPHLLDDGPCLVSTPSSQ
jgi:hypothetical protein